jgi:hypothetical protein
MLNVDLLKGFSKGAPDDKPLRAEQNFPFVSHRGAGQAHVFFPLMVKSCANNLENPGFKNKTVSS